MDGLAFMSGAGAAIDIRGTLYLMEPLRLKHWAEIEHQLLYHSHANPLREHARVHSVLSAMDSELSAYFTEKVQNHLRESKRNRMVEKHEVMQWLNSSDGIGYTAWCCLRHIPEFKTKELAEKAVIDHGSIVEFVRLRDQISGIDLLASCDWPDPLSGVRASKRKNRMEFLGKQLFEWRKIYFTLAQNHGFNQQVVNELTLYQLHVYQSSAEDLGIKTSQEEGSRGTVGRVTR